MTEERNTVYIPTWMDTSIPGLRDPHQEKPTLEELKMYEFIEECKADRLFGDLLGVDKWE